MTIAVSSDELRRLAAEEGGQIIDVLPRWEYEEEHIRGAISIPLKQLSGESAAQLHKTRPVIPYCHDYL